MVSRASMAVAGRLVADIMISAKELIRCRSYDLTEVTNQVLKEKRHEIDQDIIRSMFKYAFLSLNLSKLNLSKLCGSD